jgi:PEP-CTERM motif
MRLTAAITFVGLALSVSPAVAVPIIGTSGGWQSGHTAQENLSAYWDGNSWDSQSVFDGGDVNACNAGSLVGGSGCGLNAAARLAALAAGVNATNATNFSLAEGNSAFQYWGNENGAADLNFVFGPGSGSWYDFALLGEFTDDWAINEIGWYDPNNPTTLNTIFQATQTVGQTSLVYIPGDFGLYYRNTSGNGEMFFTQTSLNGLSGNRQQFAAFQIGDFNVVGVEDIFSQRITQAWTSTSADYDFNDVMLGFRRVNVPEPSSLLLMGLGLAAAAARARRRFTA